MVTVQLNKQTNSLSQPPIPCPSFHPSTLFCRINNSNAKQWKCVIWYIFFHAKSVGSLFVVFDSFWKVCDSYSFSFAIQFKTNNSNHLPLSCVCVFMCVCALTQSFQTPRNMEFGTVHMSIGTFPLYFLLAIGCRITCGWQKVKRNERNEKRLNPTRSLSAPLYCAQPKKLLTRINANVSILCRFCKWLCVSFYFVYWFSFAFHIHVHDLIFWHQIQNAFQCFVFLEHENVLFLPAKRECRSGGWINFGPRNYDVN